MNHQTRFTILSIIACLWLVMGLPARASAAMHAPHLSVHESHYGIGMEGTTRCSLQGISMRISSYADPQTKFIVQCFFLKRGKLPDAPKVDDTVLFEISPSHASYEVTAKPIPLAGGGKSAKKQSAKKGITSKASSAQPKDPREGYIVRILCDGIVVRAHYSGHQIERFAKEHPDLLDQAALKKSARHLDHNELLTKHL